VTNSPPSISIQLPETPLTPADLIGRAIRITRLHWRGTMKLFFFPAFINTLSLGIFYWISSHTNSHFPNQLLAILGVTALLANITSRFSIGSRTFALQTLLSGQTADIGSAMQLAKQRLPIILLITLPMVVIDLAVAASMVFSTILIERAQLGSDDAHVQGVVGTVLLAVYFWLSFPDIAFCILNGFFSATLVDEKLSFWATVKRFFSFVGKSPGFMLIFVMVSTGVYFIAAVAANIIGWFSLIPELFTGSFKIGLEIVISLFEAVLMAPFSAMWFASMAITGSCLHQYLRATLEGTDLRNRLIELQRNAIR
jgi:hypothetical protein